MTIQEWLDVASFKLQAISETPRLDAEILLSYDLSESRAWLLAHTNETLFVSGKLMDSLNRRLQSEPIAYIIGRQEFYGRVFKVTQHVLVPRPESESIIELGKIYTDKQSRIADIGCGSGALGISLALEAGVGSADFYDIDPRALSVAKTNAKHYTIAGTYYKNDLLENCHESYDIVLANLPYVPETYEINNAAAHEPRHALFGGADGLELYRRLFSQLSSLPSTPAVVITESLPFQQPKLRAIARTNNYFEKDTAGLVQVFCRR